MNRWSRKRAALWWLGPVLFLAGCGDETAGPPMKRGMGFDSKQGQKPQATAKVAAVAAAEEGTQERREPVVYRDEDFVESDRNRDPFRAYRPVVEAARESEVSQRTVLMSETGIEAMRLIAIVSGTEKPRAMILDPQNVGHVIERGMYIGRPQVVQAAGNLPMTLNWRVDRIRDNEVVLSRADPTDPNRASLTRVIPLHEELAQR